jgi:hypothetical protein
MQYIVGTGGRTQDGAATNTFANSQFYDGTAFGVLELRLLATGWKSKLIEVTNRSTGATTIRDEYPANNGVAACH